MSNYTFDEGEATDDGARRLRLRREATACAPAQEISDLPADAGDEPAAPATDCRNQLEAALKSASSAANAYAEFDYTGSFGKWAATLLLNAIILIGSAGALFPLARGLFRKRFLENVTLDGTPFRFEIKALKSCLLSLVCFGLAAASVWLWTSEPFDKALIAAVASGCAAALLLPALIHEIVHSEIEGVSFRGVRFRSDSHWIASWFYYFLIPAIAAGATFTIWYRIALIASAMRVDASAATRIVVVYSIVAWSLVIYQGHRINKCSHLSFGVRRIYHAGKLKDRLRICALPLLVWIGSDLAIMGGMSQLSSLYLKSGDDFSDMKVSVLIAGINAAIIAIALLKVALLWWAEVYVRARSLSYDLEYVDLAGLKTVDAYTTFGAAKLRLTNFLITCASLGLLAPWAVMREHRYFARNIAVVGGSKAIDTVCRLASGEPDSP